MASILEFLRRANIGAMISVCAIFFFLLARGANDASLAALLACVILVLLGVQTIAVASESFSRVLASNAVAVAAGLTFIAWSLATAAPGLPASLGLGLAHPLAEKYQGAAAAISLSPYRTIEGVVSFIGPAGAYLLGAVCAPDRDARDWAGRWIVGLSIPFCLLGVAMFFNAQVAGGARLDLGQSSANAAATLLGVIILIAASLVMRGASGRFDHGEMAAVLPKAWRWARFFVSAPISVTALILAFACLLLTASRGGLIALAVAFVVFAVALGFGRVRSGSRRRNSLVAPILALGGVAAFLFMRGGDFIAERFAVASVDAEGRGALIGAHWSAFLDRPIIGHGLNTFHELNTLLVTPENWPALAKAGAAHNIFVQMLEETGLVGAILFVLMLASPIARAVVRLARGGSGIEWASCALAVTTLCLAHGLVDFGLQVPAIAAMFTFALGAFAGAPERKRDLEPESEADPKASFRFRPSTQ